MRTQLLSDTPDSATTHTFAPSVYSSMYSAAIPPVLRVRPGDRIRTTTLDNRGYDAHLVHQSKGINPLTGPFYVEGARRGDTLAITLDIIRPNRDAAHSGARLSRKCVTAAYRETTRYDDDRRVQWRLDRQNNIARLARPTDALMNFIVPLRPFLGCIGVAPVTDQAFGTRWLGPWGGNLDYNRLGEGTTLYLPIYQGGALFSLGDGHAAQGDGEITGDAIETSMDVECTVDVLSSGVAPAIRGPRAENSRELMALGIAESMAESLQLATTALAEWVARDYRLTDNETAVVLGTAIRYDVAEVVDPMFNVVARIPKATLASLHVQTL